MLPHVTFQVTLRDEQFLTDLTRKISLMPMNHSEQSLNMLLMKIMNLYKKTKGKKCIKKIHVVVVVVVAIEP